MMFVPQWQSQHQTTAGLQVPTANKLYTFDNTYNRFCNMEKGSIIEK